MHIFGRGLIRNPDFGPYQVHIKMKEGEIAPKFPLEPFHEETGNAGPEPIFEVYAASLQGGVGIFSYNPVKGHEAENQQKKGTKKQLPPVDC